MIRKSKNFLEIKTLGEFVIKRGPVVLSEQAGRSTMLWELFKYLLTHRGSRLPADTLLETLWPDREYEDARSALKVQIYRMKKLLNGSSDLTGGDDLAITFSQGCYRLETGNQCRIDTDALEKLFNQALALSATNPAAAGEAYRKVIALYQGEYLPEITGAWVLPARNRYQRIFLKSVLELSGLYLESGRSEDAVAICEQSLKAAPLAEELHIRYLQALIGAGKMREAQGHYEYITSFYYLEMGVKPSEELKEIYRQINAKQERVELDLSAIRETMIERKKTDGAFFCQPEHFRLLCRLEKRRLERENRPVFLGLLTITRPDKSLPPAALLSPAAAELKQIISSNIRAGDVYTQWNKAQFMLFLPGFTRELGEKMLQRIGLRFKTAVKPADLILKYKIQPLLDRNPV